ncbi:MAG: hypothetical protein Kow0069_06220 [Promethearchaeota archaeon]
MSTQGKDVVEDVVAQVLGRISALRESCEENVDTENERDMFRELADLSEKLHEAKASFVNVLSRISLAIKATERYFARKYPSGPGRIRLIIPRAGKASLDLEFGTFSEFQAYEGQIPPLDRNFVFPGLQRFFQEKYGSDWDDYLATHPDEMIPTLKYEKKQVVRLDSTAEELVSKRALEAARAVLRPNAVTEVIIDAFWDNKRVLTKLMAPKDLDLVRESLSYTIIELSEAIEAKDDGKMREIYQYLSDINDELLSKYPKIALLVLLNEKNLERSPAVCERLLQTFPGLPAENTELAVELAKRERFAKYVRA